MESQSTSLLGEASWHDPLYGVRSAQVDQRVFPTFGVLLSDHTKDSSAVFSVSFGEWPSTPTHFDPEKVHMEVNFLHNNVLKFF